MAVGDVALELEATSRRAMAVAAGDAPSTRPLAAWVRVRAGGGGGGGGAPAGRYGHTMTACRRACADTLGAAAAPRDALLVLGGVSAEEPTGSAEGWWLDLTSMKWERVHGAQGGAQGWRAFSGRAFHSAVLWAAQSSVVVFGGRSSGRLLAHPCAYDLAGGAWRQLACTGEAPCAREGHAACMISSSAMVVVGGYDGEQRLADLYVLDLERMHWSKPAVAGDAELPPLSGHALTANGWQLVLSGGATPRGPSDAVFTLDLVEMRWRRRPCKGVGARMGHCAVALGGEDGAGGAGAGAHSFGPRRLFALFGHAMPDSEVLALEAAVGAAGAPDATAALSADAAAMYGAMNPSSHRCYAEAIDTMLATLPGEGAGGGGAAADGVAAREGALVSECACGDGEGPADSTGGGARGPIDVGVGAAGPCARSHAAAVSAGAASAIAFGGWDGTRALSDLWLLQLVHLQPLPAPWAHPDAGSELGAHALRARAALAHTVGARAGAQVLSAAGMDIARIPELVSGVTLEFAARQRAAHDARERRRARALSLLATIKALEVQSAADEERLKRQRERLELEREELRALKEWTAEGDTGGGRPTLATRESDADGTQATALRQHSARALDACEGPDARSPLSPIQASVKGLETISLLGNGRKGPAPVGASEATVAAAPSTGAMEVAHAAMPAGVA